MSSVLLTGQAFAQNLTDGDPSNDVCVSITTSVLRFKMTDATTNGDVSYIQDFLISKGFLSGSPTGYYERLTVTAVKAYQRSIGVSQTGNVGPLTKNYIEKETCGEDGTQARTSTPDPVSRSTPSQALESSLEVISAPKISLQYDNSGKESVLVGQTTIKITAGQNGLDYNLLNGVPSLFYFSGSSRGTSWSKGARLSNSSGTSQETGSHHLYPGVSEIYNISITAPTKELYADTYSAALVGGLYNASGVVLSVASYKGVLRSNSVAILGEMVSPQTPNKPTLSKNVSVALCQVTMPVLEGIGDGCSLNYEGFNLATIPHIGVFRGTFTSACNRHDRCYTTLGYSTSKCNSDFLSDMRSACKSKYNRLLRPAEYLACNQTALEYKAAVDVFTSTKNPGPAFQSELVSLSKKVQMDVNKGMCVTTPERTNIFSPEIIEQVNSTFIAEAGRKPDFNEFFTSINNFYSPEDYSLSTQKLKDYAKAEAVLKIPDGEVMLENTTLKIKNPLPGAVYIWRIDGYLESEGDHMDIPVELDPKYDIDKDLKGYVNVTAKGFSNKLIIDTKLRIRGECGKKTLEPCILR